jgi:hypothetical protein
MSPKKEGSRQIISGMKRRLEERRGDLLRVDRKRLCIRQGIESLQKELELEVSRQAMLHNGQEGRVTGLPECILAHCHSFLGELSDFRNCSLACKAWYNHLEFLFLSVPFLFCFLTKCALPPPPLGTLPLFTTTRVRKESRASTPAFSNV